MTIEYEEQKLDVEVLEFDSWDDDQPYCLKFPQDHAMFDPKGVWVDAREYVVLNA